MPASPPSLLAHDPPRLAVFASGRGSNLDAIRRAIAEGTLTASLELVITNRADAGALQIAWDHGIAALVLNPARYGSAESYASDLLQYLKHHEIDLIILAGYLRQLPAPLVAAYLGRILNIHPAPLPRFGGKGMYGLRVHEAVLAAGVTESGPTIHVVTAEYDEGPVLAFEPVPVLDDDTPEILAARVLEVEHWLYPQTIQRAIESLRAGRALTAEGA